MVAEAKGKIAMGRAALESAPPQLNGSKPDSAEVPSGANPQNAQFATALEERRRNIAEAAYYRAERRGFAPGYEDADWLDAEKETDAEDRSSGKQRET